MPIDAWWSGDTLSQSDNRFIDSLEVFIRLRQNTLSRFIGAAGMISLRQGLLLDRDGGANKR